ncbi:polysaccharide pyruvyl transferase family protein [Acetobacteraceae bacterium H6797]|nr:polysaccharide pyruvyl transferase family protein [Acetobacteraceae bacterium H6797]
MKRIKFVGWYGRGNCGDEAFKDVHRLLFPGQDLEWVTDVDAEPSDDDEAVYVLGGGDVFLPYYLRSIPKNRKFFVYGVGLGSPDQVQAIVAEKDRIKGIWLRNEGDVAILREQGVNNARFTPDIVFNLRPEVEKLAPSMQPKLLKKRKSLALIVSNTATQASARNGNFIEYFYAQYMRLMLAVVTDELAKFYDIYGIPFSTDRNDYDLGYLYDVVGNMKQQASVKVFDEPLTPLEVGALIANMDLVVSMKFHGLVFAAAAGVPFVNIGLTRKTKLICDQLDFTNLGVQPYSFAYETMMGAVKRAETPETRSALDERRNRMYELAASEADVFVKMVTEAMHDPASMKI